MDFSIETWIPDHPRWQELVSVVASEDQTRWAFHPYFETFPRHFLVAVQGEKVVGFLMFVVWEIGPHDRDHPVIQLHGKTLTEAKIIAFGVQSDYRRQGMGRALQEHALSQAKVYDCFQLRSVSDSNHPENYQLKLSMGFAVEPMERQEKSVAFIMPLRSTKRKIGG